MNNFTYIVLVFAFLLTNAAAPALAATPTLGTTPTQIPTPTDVKSKQVEDLKERLATKVAQLQTTSPRAIVGSVKTISVSSITVETTTKDLKIELTDDIKVVQIIRGVRTEFTTDDLDTGDPVVIFGNMDTTLDILTAKVIFIGAVSTQRVSGSVTAIDTEAFTLTIQSGDNKNYLIDIEKATKTTAWDKVGGLAKSGFSKVALGDTLHILGTPVPKETNRLSAMRILNLGNMTGAVTPTSSPAPTPKPSPTAKSTPSPSVKPTP